MLKAGGNTGQRQGRETEAKPVFPPLRPMAAEAVEEASKDGPYLSLDDFRQRTKVSKTVIDLMAELGLFGNLPQSNQLSLFDFS